MLLTYSPFKLVMFLGSFLSYLRQNTVNDCSTNSTRGVKLTSCAESQTADSNCGLKERQSQHSHRNRHLTAFPMDFPILPCFIP